MQQNPVVLIVDDDPCDRELLELAFRAACAGVVIHFATDGAVAIAYLQGDGAYADRRRFPYPHLVITDLKMPGVDGFAVLEFLKLHPHLFVVPTVMLSGSSDQDDVVTAYRLGASSYLAKPATALGTNAMVKALVDYWRCCEAPIVSPGGGHLRTDSRGKLGERFGISADRSASLGAGSSAPFVRPRSGSSEAERSPDRGASSPDNDGAYI